MLCLQNPYTKNQTSSRSTASVRKAVIVMTRAESTSTWLAKCSQHVMPGKWKLATQQHSRFHWKLIRNNPTALMIMLSAVAIVNCCHHGYPKIKQAEMLNESLNQHSLPNHHRLIKLKPYRSHVISKRHQMTTSQRGTSFVCQSLLAFLDVPVPSVPSPAVYVPSQVPSSAPWLSSWAGHDLYSNWSQVSVNGQKDEMIKSMTHTPFSHLKHFSVITYPKKRQSVSLIYK